MQFNPWTLRPESFHQGLHRADLGPDEGPMFSIITITWNRLHTIKRTIASVEAQTYKNYEFIIVDSASNDGTIEYLDQNPHLYDYYVSEKDEGICDGANRGLQLANGKFVYFLFSDDWIPDNFLEKAYKAFENVDDNTGFIYGNAEVNSESGSRWILKGDPQYQRKIRYMMPIINFPGVVMRREMTTQVKFFDLNIDVPSDYDFILRAHILGWKGKYIPNLFSYFSKGGNSTTKELKGHFEVFRIACRHAGFSLGAFLALARNVTRYFGKYCISKLPSSYEDRVYQLYHKWRS